MSIVFQVGRILLAFGAVAAAAAATSERVVLVADSRRFTGWEAWCANLYNESHFYFALLTILIIPGLGLLLGKATDLVLARMGINLRSRVVSER